MNRDLVCPNLSVSQDGTLFVGKHSTKELATKYSTPLYVMDEDLIRSRCHEYKKAAEEAFEGNYKIFYASKAASFKQIYRIMKEENMCIDVVSAGEIATAKSAGFPMENASFHSNNKTDADIEYALDCKVGCFVADNIEELVALNEKAGERGIRQRVMLRLTPGIDPHTYEAISTGKVDSKFGFAIETGQAFEAVEKVISLKNLDFEGIHCHVGSQVFDTNVYIRSAEIMLDFANKIKQKLSFEIRELGLGGGFGARYTEADPTMQIGKNIAFIGNYVKEKCKVLGMKVPTLSFEPGRSIVGEAGVTLYSVGTVKRIKGYKNYVSVDGGMTDNIRHALYGAKYTVFAAEKMNDKCDMECTLVGKCCESGDVIARELMLPDDVKRGDILACLTTGAYHYSMSSNYNRIPRPAIVMLKGEESYIAVKRESFEDLSRLDV